MVIVREWLILEVRMVAHNVMVSNSCCCIQSMSPGLELRSSGFVLRSSGFERRSSGFERRSSGFERRSSGFAPCSLGSSSSSSRLHTRSCRGSPGRREAALTGSFLPLWC
uniref:Uncharacterized protein n=1 Tax=Sander lucioperca TaxID=283035 RepID=A0A8D0D7L7_SANLU